MNAVWVLIAPRESPSPSAHPVVQLIDWKLGGGISKYILNKSSHRTEDTVLATMGRLSFPYVVLQEFGLHSWERFKAMAEGMQWSHVGIVGETQEMASQIQTEIKRMKGLPFKAEVIER